MCVYIILKYYANIYYFKMVNILPVSISNVPLMHKYEKIPISGV